MSDSVSKIYDDYADYESLCEYYNKKPIGLWDTCSSWLDEYYNLKDKFKIENNPEFKKGEKYSMAEKLQIGTFRNGLV